MPNGVLAFSSQAFVDPHAAARIGRCNQDEGGDNQQGDAPLRGGSRSSGSQDFVV
ncbi:MAG: hypothetical protein ACRYG8_52515 [Janthinobacterium lividum]